MTDLWISFTPLDTLFFRDGRPFSMGEETWADGIFPPPPSVFLGAMRSAVLSLQPENYATMTNNDPTSGIVIKNIHLSYNRADELLFPTPGDVVRRKVRRKGDEIPPLLTLDKNNRYNNYPLDYLLTNPIPDEIENYPFNHFLDIPSFEEYLSGILPGQPTSIPICSEPKIGIGRTKIRNSIIDGKLYRVGMQRFADYGGNRHDGNRLCFIIQYEIPDEIATLIRNNRLSFAKFGGENKVVEVALLTGSPGLKLPVFNSEDRTFKIVLTTPALFKNGWIPDFIDPQNYTGHLDGVRVKLIAAMTGKPQAFGGFDMLARKPKPLVKAIPPGSVFFFQIIEDSHSIETFAQNLKGSFSISEERKEEGFGLAYLGKVREQINSVL